MSRRPTLRGPLFCLRRVELMRKQNCCRSFVFSQKSGEMYFAVYRVFATMPPGGAVFDGGVPSVQRPVFPRGQVPRHAVIRAGLALAVKAVSDGLGWVRLGSVNDVLHPCGGHSLSFCRYESVGKRRYRPAVAHGGGVGKEARFSTQCGSSVSQRRQQAAGWVGEYTL